VGQTLNVQGCLGASACAGHCDCSVLRSLCRFWHEVCGAAALGCCAALCVGGAIDTLRERTMAARNKFILADDASGAAVRCISSGVRLCSSVSSESDLFWSQCLGTKNGKSF